MKNKTEIGFLFDLDGVLIDSETRYSQIWREINRLYPSGFDDLETRIKGTTLENILSTYFPEVKAEVTKILYEKENEMIYDYCFGALSFLEKIKDYKSALVTSSNEVKLQRLWLQHPELKSYFDVVIDGSMVKNSKPDPEGYLLAAERLGVNSKNCVVFEDSLQGVKAGRNSGAFVVGIAGTLPAEVLKEDSDIIVNRLDEPDFEILCKTLINR